MTFDPPPAVATAPEIDRRRVLRLIEEQRKLLAERTPRSGEYYERARRVMPNGVPSSFQENDPWPVYIERGAGAQV
jgi:glutamate-1-semialdehyde 2,1-aminomutase